jgi:hypothetical protein
MEEAYMEASDNNTLPANARQIMYRARPLILRMITADKFNDKHFTQKLIPKFLEQNPELTADWDVVYDARGHFREPHTGHTVPVGTVEVRRYLGERAELAPVARFPFDIMFPTSGPKKSLPQCAVRREGRL